jgi:undecaprenyl-phosphate 4-deoxy-4-formamido-L-arabinose transferase
LAGLSHAKGTYVAVLDDDGQNPPAQVWPMLRKIKQENLDCVYGFYIEKQHSWFRNAGSRFNDWVATVMLGKPKHIYLSSFKVMHSFVVKQVLQYKGAFPYIDGLIFRVTANISQIPVVHAKRIEGKSGYTLKKLVSLWLNMFLNFSIGPLRVAVVLGLLTSLASVPLVFVIIIDKILNPDVTVGVPSILVTITFFAGIQLLNMGLVGEYLGRIFLDMSGRPQFVVRYAMSSDLAHSIEQMPEPIQSES